MRIRLARDTDAGLLPALERSAGEAFRQVTGLAWIADEADQTVERYLDLIAKGSSWVAVDADDWPIGFLSAEVLAGELHVWEFAVRLDLQRLGHGTALLEHAIADARVRGLAAVTLTTFRDVDWNEAYYLRRGFRTLDSNQLGERLRQVLRAEVERGFPEERRCAMRLALG